MGSISSAEGKYHEKIPSMPSKTTASPYVPSKFPKFPL
jgi:hypothetical protein